MRTDCVPVAPDVELAVDDWTAAERADEVPAPMLLVHGLASNARLWDGVAARLAASGHEIWTVDLRGHGRSSKPDAGYDVPTVADDLAHLIETLGLRRPIVAGQSWGGNVVLELAARHPSLVGGIVCVDGGWIDLQSAFPSWEACRERLSPPRLVGRPLVEVEGYLRAAHPDWPETGIRGSLANFEVRPDGTIAPWLTFDRHMLVLRGLWEHRPAERYPTLVPPALLVPADGGGHEDGARKHLTVEAAGAAIPCAEVRWFKGDHDIHAQHPDELADVMDDAADHGLFARP
jgi:pimeloyl-ACP methyl ester carboxylesterase